jgi:hypothetical protein
VTVASQKHVKNFTWGNSLKKKKSAWINNIKGNVVGKEVVTFKEEHNILGPCPMAVSDITGLNCLSSLLKRYLHTSIRKMREIALDLN